MSSTVISRCGITLHDVSAQIKEKSISRLIQNYLPNTPVKVNRGDIHYKMGKEVHRILITLNKPESVDQLMKHRSDILIDGQKLRITRTLPKSYLLYNRSVTGLKIKIHQSVNDNVPNVRLNEADLRRHFEHFGTIRYCQWTNANQTEALFAFTDYDFVDKIIIWDPSPKIKGIKVELEKSWTNEDYPTFERSYIIHVTNLPLCVTSEEISKHFNVPIAVILLYPCFRLEQCYLVDGRSSSEAWIKNFSDEKTTQALAIEKTGTFLRTNKIQCEAMLETIDDEQELCEHFQKGQCQYTMDTCYNKHFTCDAPDTCDNQNCWFGHSRQRTTKSINRPKYRSEDAQYRVKFSNLPSNVTHESLMTRLNIDPKSSQYLIIQPTEQNSDTPKMAYLIRQPLENKLRQQIDAWHNTSFLPIITRKIQCQLEINQDYYDWNDSTDIPRSRNNSRCVSPVLSTQSARSDRTNPALRLTYAASTSSCTPSQSKKAHTVGQSHIVKPIPTYPSTVQKNISITNTLKSKSVVGIRPPPSDFSNLSTQWRWTNQMILNDQYDRDEMYWIEDQSNKQKNVVIKMYSSKTDRTAGARAQRERVALEKLNKVICVPKLLTNNIDASINDQSKKELWTIMKLIDGERLSDYIKGNKLDFHQALQMTRRLLNLIKQIHAKNVVHRDIQPKNILLGPRSNNNEISLMLINFSSAWINGDQRTNLIESLDEQLGNEFYRMPQFEIRGEKEDEQNEDNEQLKQFRRSFTIDTTGICAILFWLVTGHEPKESQDIWRKAPHCLRDNAKIIEKKIIEITAFRMEMRTHEHLQRHLMFTFDRCFGGPIQQWSVDQLDYQLQFMIALIEGENEQNNYFPSSQNTIDNILLPSIPFNDPFVYVVSLIHHLKNQFATRYSNCIRWSTEGKNHWCTQNGRIENSDMIIFRYKTKNISVDIQWIVTLSKEQQFAIFIKAKDHNKNDIQLPLGLWKINDQQNDFHLHLNNFEMEIKILINLLCQSIKLEN